MQKSILPKSILPLVLVGMMGCGKSTVGKQLSQRLNLQFYDIDHEIENKVGASVVDIFKFQGEDYFRSVERQVIGEFLSGGRCVLSTGGGAFIQDEVRSLCKDSCVSYFLRVPEDVLWGRVKHNNMRPLVRDRDDELSFRELYTKRLPFYELADELVECGNKPVESLLLELVTRM